MSAWHQDPDPLYVEEEDAVRRPIPQAASPFFLFALVLILLASLGLAALVLGTVPRRAPPAATPPAVVVGLPGAPLGASVGRPGRSGSRPASILSGGAPLSGWATWYDDGPGLYGAAGPSLRRALGRGWRGDHVQVCASRCVVVVLSDWCACGRRRGVPTLIDLSPAAFSRIAPLSAGVVRVTIGGVPSREPTPTGPPTDVEP